MSQNRLRPSDLIRWAAQHNLALTITETPDGARHYRFEPLDGAPPPGDNPWNKVLE